VLRSFAVETHDDFKPQFKEKAAQSVQESIAEACFKLQRADRDANSDFSMLRALLAPARSIGVTDARTHMMCGLAMVGFLFENLCVGMSS